jgi:uncharacterized protein
MAYRTIFATLAFTCLSFMASAQTLTFPVLAGRVVDDAGVLNAPDRASLTNALASLEAKTTDQLVVVTLKSLQGTSIEDYGYQLGRAWQIGQKDTNTGVLLIVAPNEHKVRIEVGYGLEGTLTDAVTKLIIEDDILPRFKVGDFSGGIRQGAAATPRPSMSPASSDKPVWPLVAVFAIACGLMILCALTRGGGICRGIMQLLFLMLLFGGRGDSSRGNSSFSGGGGSFGGGGASGSW